MGIYDRDYYRDDGGGFSRPWTMVLTLIVINVVVYFVDVLFFYEGPLRPDRLVSFGHLPQQWIHEPWKVWQFVTYGFLHAQSNIMHILFNMLALWLFGAELEQIYGRREFLRVYLSLGILAGLTWLLVENVVQPGKMSSVIGASGAVMGLMVISVCHFPRRTYLFNFFIPVPAWLLAIFYLAWDILGLAGVDRGSPDKPHVAFAAHLGGAFFGFVYFKTRWNLFRLIPQKLTRAQWKSRPKLRVHQDEEEGLSDQKRQARLDEILEKITKSGEDSLTRDERRFLEETSRRFKQRRG